MTIKIPVVLVVAAADNGAIGRDGKLPWRLPSDLRLFRKLTIGKPVIMGRRTFQSLRKPLIDRDNIVVTHDHAFVADGTLAAHSFDDALTLAERCAIARNASEIAVIGGATIYRQALPVANIVYLTRVHASPPGDTFMPDLPPADWIEVGRETLPQDPADEFPASLITLRRRTAS